MRRYFKEKESGRILTKTMEIKNGVILGEVDESDGLHIHGTEFFVNHEEFKKGYEKTKFTPHPDTVAKGIIASALKDVVYELNNYGLMEELVRSFEEAVDSMKSSIFKKMFMYCNPQVETTPAVDPNDRKKQMYKIKLKTGLSQRDVLSAGASLRTYEGDLYFDNETVVVNSVKKEAQRVFEDLQKKGLADSFGQMFLYD